MFKGLFRPVRWWTRGASGKRIKRLLVALALLIAAAFAVRPLWPSAFQPSSVGSTSYETIVIRTTDGVALFMQTGWIDASTGASVDRPPGAYGYARVEMGRASARRFLGAYLAEGTFVTVGPGQSNPANLSEDEWRLVALRLVEAIKAVNREYDRVNPSRPNVWTYEYQWDRLPGILPTLLVFRIAPLAAALVVLDVLLLVSPAARRTRRLAQGLCPHCAYSRQGLSPETLCPECGRLPTLAPPT